MAGYENAFSTLNKVAEKIHSRRGMIPKKLAEKELRPAYHAVCSLYETSTQEQRLDTYLLFDLRDNLLDALVTFAEDCVKEADVLSNKGKPDKALSLVKQAVIADLILDGRSHPQQVERMQDSLLNAVEKAGFDLASYTAKLDIPAAAFAKRASQLYKQAPRRDEAVRTAAFKALGVALQTNPALANHPTATSMAQDLTGKPVADALAILSEPFERAMFLDDRTRHADRRSRKAGKAPETPLKFWATTVFGTIFLAVLPPLTFPTVLGMEADPSGLPPGLIVGAVTSFLYAMNQLKSRPKSRR